MRFQSAGNKDKILSFQSSKSKSHTKSQNCFRLWTYQKLEGNGAMSSTSCRKINSNLEFCIHPNSKSECKRYLQAARSQEIYFPCTLSQEATERCAPPKQGSSQKDENMGYRTQECQYRRVVKGVPVMVMREDFRVTAVHTRQTSPDLSQSQSSRETSLYSLNW